MDEPGDVSNNFNNSQETSEPQDLMEEPVKQETGDETATEVHSSGPEMSTPPNMPVAQVAEKKEEQEPVDRKEKSRTSTSSGEPQQDSVTTSQEMPPPPNVPMLPEAEKREELETVDRKENKPSREQDHPPG
ncbi:uncharacterized protein LOC131929012 [Physella acuta]|uniref:uncharacterized protein LOC131929012 n=1 Tax=Physella acuta TaxID=109671 RepID=UPI0027DD4FEB|nr:uncharacterized protein LOC131929012 [Physella acuta]